MFTRSLLACALLAGMPAHAERLGLGSAASLELIRAWDIDVAPSGRGLPSGQGSVAVGERVYAERCAACHGARGEGGAQDRLSGGQGSLASDKPIKTVGSFWPYATTLFDYVRRAMPFNAPQSLDTNEVYAVVAYLLFLNGIVASDAQLDAVSLPAVHMPNRDGFVWDPRPDFSGGAR